MPATIGMALNLNDGPGSAVPSDNLDVGASVRIDALDLLPLQHFLSGLRLLLCLIGLLSNLGLMVRGARRTLRIGNFLCLLIGLALRSLLWLFRDSPHPLNHIGLRVLRNALGNRVPSVGNLAPRPLKI